MTTENVKQKLDDRSADWFLQNLVNIFDRSKMKYKDILEYEINNAIEKMMQLKYDWKAKDGDNPYMRKLDSKIFNRKQGYEVVWMIKKVLEDFGYKTVSDVRKKENIVKKIESVIDEKLPGDVRSSKEVFDWLVKYLNDKIN